MTLPARALREIQWPRVLDRGDHGADVRRMQEWLTLHGFPLLIDGDFGGATARQLARFQNQQGMDAQPHASLECLCRLSAPIETAFRCNGVGATLRETVIGVARAHLAENPREAGGDNRGPWVRAYNGADGMRQRWCAGFVTTIVEQACALHDTAMPIARTTSCDALAFSARGSLRLVRQPGYVEGGDLFLIRAPMTPDDWIHTGIVTQMHSDSFDTIEGNTNSEGGANGFEVCARTRGLARVDYIRLG